jgi:hypothetical protein
MDTLFGEDGTTAFDCLDLATYKDEHVIRPGLGNLSSVVQFGIST